MPIPVKPCEGHFSEELQEALARNRDRTQWATHACEVCGTVVGATLEKGKWVPESHWPSVKYQPRAKNEKKQKTAAPDSAPDDATVLAGFASR